MVILELMEWDWMGWNGMDLMDAVWRKHFMH